MPDKGIETTNEAKTFSNLGVNIILNNYFTIKNTVNTCASMVKTTASDHALLKKKKCSNTQTVRAGKLNLKDS